MKVQRCLILYHHLKAINSKSIFVLWIHSLKFQQVTQNNKDITIQKLESTEFYNGLISGGAILSSYFHTHLSKHLSEIRIAPFVHHPTLLAHTPTPTNL